MPFLLGAMTKLSTSQTVVQMSMSVRDDWQGKGVASALMPAMIDLADKWLNLSRPELEVYTSNEAATHLYKKFGFVTEGTPHHKCVIIRTIK